MLMKEASQKIETSRIKLTKKGEMLDHVIYGI